MDNYSLYELEYKKGNLANANFYLMYALADLLVKDRENFVHLLNECNIEASIQESDASLITKYVNNLVNRKLLLGTAMLVSMQNKKSSFDDELNDDDIKKTYNTMRVFYIGNESYSNAGADPVSAVATALGEGAKLGTAITNKKSQPLQFIQSKQQANQALVSGVLQARQAQLEEERKKQEAVQKTFRYLAIGGAVVVVAIIGLIMYKKSKGK